MAESTEDGRSRPSEVQRRRNPWLDLLRASAIMAVMAHHLGQEWPVHRAWLDGYTVMGAEGVDLFFVLSGWLIGGLFWKEMALSSRVRLFRFWARRWLRTVPPYAGGLLLAWIAVWVYRGEPFDPLYLVFMQNYHEQMPFFFVSWSLCIEEHFYLFIPAVFLLLMRLRRALVIVLPLLPAGFDTSNIPGRSKASATIPRRPIFTPMGCCCPLRPFGSK